MPFMIIAAFIALFVAFAVIGHLQAKKRREAFSTLAMDLGLSFSPEKDHGVPARYTFLDKLRQGSNRYAFNVLQGRYRDHAVCIFDFHYETHSTDSKGRRQTHHHYFSFFILSLPRAFPELTIGPEGIFSKLAQAVGFDDIDFESAEFSRRFCVRSKDKKFAYDFCHARMIEFLLSHGGKMAIEVENQALALGCNSRLKPEQVRPHLDHLISIRELMPDYLFEGVC
jgi:hypothetical protein